MRRSARSTSWVVAGEQERDPARAVELLEDVKELLRRLRIEGGRGLVREDEDGLPDDRARDRDALALPSRKGVRTPVLSPARPTAASADRERLSAQTSSGSPRIQSARATFSSAESTGTSWCAWKTKPIFSRRRRAAALVERGDVLAVEDEGARVRQVQQAEQVQEIVLPLPEGPARTANSPAWRTRDVSDTPTTRSSPRR